MLAVRVFPSADKRHLPHSQFWVYAIGNTSPMGYNSHVSVVPVQTRTQSANRTVSWQGTVATVVGLLRSFDCECRYGKNSLPRGRVNFSGRGCGWQSEPRRVPASSRAQNGQIDRAGRIADWLRNRGGIAI